jgi:hypothetical protein
MYYMYTHVCKVRYPREKGSGRGISSSLPAVMQRRANGESSSTSVKAGRRSSKVDTSAYLHHTCRYSGRVVSAHKPDLKH